MGRLGTIAWKLNQLSPGDLVSTSGLVTDVADGKLGVVGLARLLRLGDQVRIETANGTRSAFVARISDATTIVVPVETDIEVRIGDRVTAAGPLCLRPDLSWQGRALNALGQPIDGGASLRQGAKAIAVDRKAPRALARSPIGGAIRTGVTAIDIFTPLCGGQRLGLFAGSGVGKSTLLAMLSKAPQAAIIILALVGERGREVNEFLNHTLAGSRDKVIAVVATSDESTTMRRLAPRTAMAIAEYFRDQGHQVLMIMDSLTRFALAQRDYAMAAGEPPVARGFPPSVFKELATLLERAGPGEHGTAITLIATVLIDGDDHNDPVADAVRGIVDGHIVLDRAIGSSGRWPAIDVLSSLSRLADRAWSPDQARLAAEARGLIECFEDTKDMRSLGDYRVGSDAYVDRAVSIVPQLYRALNQRPTDAAVADPFLVLAELLRKPLA